MVGVKRRVVLAVFTSIVCWAAGARAQAPAAAAPPPDDTPSIKLGATLFTDYTYNQSPKQRDADGNLVNFNQFNVGRAYLNITGNASHVVAFRITPDVSRETGTGSSLSGSLEFRIKYAFAQFNLDDWTTKGSWIRLGIQQTPWVDFEEGIYRYRFQGTVFSEREGFLSSSDAGASFHYALPANYGEVHVGVYNGETYSKTEVNDQKAFQTRVSLRPFPAGPMALRGLRGHLFYDADSYLAGADRRRFIGSVTFEHKYVNAEAEYLDGRDQVSSVLPLIDGKGYSIWATPRAHGWEGLLRYDHLTPNETFDSQARKRTILGVSYWFPMKNNVTTAILVDYDNATFRNILPARPKETKLAVHALLNF